MILIDEAALASYVAKHREATLAYARKVLDADPVCNPNRRTVEQRTAELADKLDEAIADFLRSAWEQDAMDADAREQAAYERSIGL